MRTIKNVYFFSISAPLGDGEVFLKNEIEYWLKEKEVQLTLVPTKINPGHTGEIPDYVDTSLSLALKDSTAVKKKLILKPKTWVTCLLNVPLKFKLKPSVYRTVLDVYTQQVITLEWLKQQKINEHSRFYSFWLSNSILAISNYLKKKPTIGAKVFSRTHRFDLYEYTQNFGFFPFRDQQIESLDALFPASKEAVHYLSERYSKKVSIELKKLGVRVGENFQHAKDNQDNQFKFVTCSYISPVKRVDLIAERLIKFAEANAQKKIEWIHFGDGDERQKVLNVLKHTPENFSHKLMPFTPNDKLQHYYQTNWIDAFINLSLSEGQPVSIMEAMSNGIPCLATDVGGVSGLVSNGATGYLLPSDHEQEDFNETLSKLITDNGIKRDEIRTFIKENNSLEMQFEIIKKPILS